MHTKIISALLAVTILLSGVLLASCSGESDFPATVNNTVIKEEPENIVALTKNLADIVSTLGYDVKLVGRSDEVTQQGMHVVPVVGTAQSPIPASVDEVKASVVLADSTLDPTAQKELEKRGVAVITLEDAPTPKQVRGLYKKIGIALAGNIKGKKEGADAYDKLSKTLKDVRDAAAFDNNNILKTVAYLYIDNGALKTFNQNTWGSTMLGLTGALNVFKSADTDVVDTAALALSNPDYIFCADKTTLDFIRSSDALKKLSALKTAKIIPYDEITMQGNTALNVLETMVKEMYPEEFTS